MKKNDEWFTPESEINWTEQKLHVKLSNLARVIKFMNDGNGPDILGIEEVENQKLLIDLIELYLKNNQNTPNTSRWNRKLNFKNYYTKCVRKN